ncbi:cytochrome P450 [Nocardia sp. 2]|uniref:Cytochrome P450 n=1 Tax=Nocardia acididurans TaxID=2802282 RepID=A0ABS1M821_9NOCA|nr:cytochrome P450 [Nocardia acididurans]MBL1076783.1 cytochrome P450 [Nocardia acididurans]
MSTVISEAQGRQSVSHRPSHRTSTRIATVEALTIGLDHRAGLIGRIKGHDVLRFRAGTRRYVALGHPDHVDQVLHTGRLNFHKAFEYEILRALLGVSLFTDEDESWQRHRTMLNPMFARRHLNGLLELMAEPMRAGVDALDTGAARLELDMVDEMVRLTLNVVGNALFGQQFGHIAVRMSGLVTDGLRFGERLERLFVIAAPPKRLWRATSRVAFTPVPLPPPLRKIQRIVRTLDAEVWRVVRERHENPTDSPDLLNHLLTAAGEQGGLPLKRVRDEALTFMLAGHETTANALSWMWYLLALHPRARDRMLDEIDTVLRGRPPGVADLPRLTWTAACFQEAMRYYSPAWVIPRVAVRDTVIDGHRIRRGTTVILPSHHIHHDDRWWPDPEQFDPSRFLPGTARTRPRSAYLPFGGGRRMCIGSSFALMEAVLITAIWSQRYVFDLVPGHPVEPEATLTLRPRHGLRMVARPRTPIR